MLYLALAALICVLTGFLIRCARRRRRLSAPRSAPAGARTQALEKQTRRSLAVFLSIVLLMAAGISVVGYLSYVNFKSRFRAQVESELDSVARLKAAELKAWRAERLGDAEILRENPAFAALAKRYLDHPADGQARAQLQAWLDRYQAYRQYDRIYLLDAHGAERLSSPAVSEPADSGLIRTATAGLRAGQVTFLDFHRDSNDAPVHLSLLVPLVTEENHAPLGTLVLSIDPKKYLFPFIQQWPTPSASAETLLVRREGPEVLFLNELKFRSETALNLRIPLENTRVLAVKAVLGKEGIVEGVDYRGTPALGAVYAVTGSPWFLVARMDLAEIYGPLRERLRQTLVFFGALMAASAAGLGLVWRRQRLRYYRGQAEAAQALRASGEALAVQRRIADTFIRVYDDNIFYEVLRVVLEVLHSPYGVFGYIDEAGALVVPSMTRDIWDKCRVADKTYIFPRDTWGHSSWSTAVRERRIVHSNEASSSVPAGHVGIRRHISMPIMIEGEVIGLLQVANKEKDYTDADLSSLGAIADHIAPILSARMRRKRAENDMLAAQAELRRLLDVAGQSRRALLSVVEDQKTAEEEIRKLNAELEQRVRERTAQLEAVNKDLEAFTYSVSHDLRAPLRGINGWSLALMEDYQDKIDDRGRQYLGHVLSETQRMGQLIDDLLKFSHESRIDLKWQEVDMTSLAQTVASRLRQAQAAARVEFVIQPDLTARGDVRLLEIVLTNLLDNAVKFSGRSSQALVEFGRTDRNGHAAFYVRDNGVGFDMAYGHKLFKVFQRLHKQTEFPGTGIGLAIVQRIISRHGGLIWAESQVGRGASFYFTLEEA